jgi:putative membrane protein insertion efficiency factor
VTAGGGKREGGSDHPQPGIAARACMACVRGYQVTLSRIVGGHCRFHPSCSHYAIDALRMHGALRGMWLTVRRLARCHPWGGQGDDPVPPR